MNEALVMETMARQAVRREARRDFLRVAGVFAAGAAGAVALNAGAGGLVSAAQAQSMAAVSDEDILNFALNLEYLEAQFYAYATTGAGLPASLLTGTGRQGPVLGGAQVPFSDPVVKAAAMEIANDEMNHVIFLRTALGSAAVAQPEIDIDGTDPNGSFSTAARAAGLVGPGVAFNPYANDIDFLLGAFIFEDVGVTAYKGAAPLLTSKVYLSAAAGILAAEAYHAGYIRTTLYNKGQTTPIAISGATAISNARDALDNPFDDDQGFVLHGKPNLFTLDRNSIAFGRTTGDVLNIVYLNGGVANRGGFFPRGVNGTIHVSS